MAQSLERRVTIDKGRVEMTDGNDFQGAAQVYGTAVGDPSSESCGHKGDSHGPFDEEQHDGVEQEGLSESQRKVALLAVWASFMDVGVSGSIIVIALAHAYRDNGVSLYCLSIQAFSHLMSSVLLGIRFWCEYQMPQDAPAGIGEGLLRQRRRAHLLREQQVSVLMGLVMLISVIGLLFKAFRKLRFWDKWHLDHIGLDEDAATATEFLAWYGAAVYTLQAGMRLLVAVRLRRAFAWHGFVTSIVSLLFLLVLAIGATEEKEWSWKAEPIAAIVLSGVMLVEGIRVIYNHFDDVDQRLLNDSRA